MLFRAQRPVVFVVLAVKALVVKTKHELVAIVHFDVALAEKHILLAADRVSMDLRQQPRLRRRRSRADIRNVHHLRHIRALAIISEKEEGAVLLNRTTDASAELIDL